MPQDSTVQIDIVLQVEDIAREADQLQARLTKAEEEQARKWGVPCVCPCGCRVRHRYGKTCVLCRDGDHWTRIVELLDRVMERRSA